MADTAVVMAVVMAADTRCRTYHNTAPTRHRISDHLSLETVTQATTRTVLPLGSVLVEALMGTVRDLVVTATDLVVMEADSVVMETALVDIEAAAVSRSIWDGSRAKLFCFHLP